MKQLQEKVMCTNVIAKLNIRDVEDKYFSSYCTSFKFSNSLYKFTNIELPDKYDHNYFYYVNTPTDEEINNAIKYQKDRNLNFIKLKGRKALSLDGFIDESIYALIYRGKQKIELGDNITVKKCEIDEVKNLELRNFSNDCGADYIGRNVDISFNHVEYIGIYENNELRGHCFIYKKGKYTMLDGLAVDEPYRHQKYATKLLLSLCNKYTFLHAEVNEKEKELYIKLGFKIVDTSYEYRKML